MNYKHGKCLKKYYCKKCNKKITFKSGIYGSGLCRKCSDKICHKSNKTSFKKGFIPWNKGLTKKTDERILKSTKKIKGKNNPVFRNPKHNKQFKGGRYKGIYFRSSWERIYAKWLDKSKIKWIYEPKAFKLKNTTYTPDFYLPERNRYIEVKGFWMRDSKKKYKQFKKLYPNIKISLILKIEIERMKKSLKI